MADEVLESLDALLRASRVGVLTTIKQDGRPQLSNVLCVYDPATRVVRLSTAADRAKIANLRRDPRAGLYATSPDYGTYAVAEGTAELTPVAADPHDDVVEELIEVYRLISGEHPDWDEFRAAMVAERRLIVRLHVERAYGQVPNGQ